jgi:polyisoprenyl-phosphate glycosyltransferase
VTEALSLATSPALSMVVPCYNEEANVAELVRRLVAAAEADVGGSYEIVLVNDGSTDGTWSEMLALSASTPALVAINLSRNHGHQLALSAGLELCRGKRVMVLDADLQDPPELLGPMMRRMDEGFDVVFGQREAREGETRFKRATAYLFYRTMTALGSLPIPHDTGDFRLMSRRVVDQLMAMPEQYRFIRGMVTWVGFRQCALPYKREKRLAGESHYGIRQMLRFAIDAITSFSILPLRCASFLGFAVGTAGLGALGYVLVSWLAGRTIPGWTSLAALVLIPSSIQLFVLGVFGEYIGRMYMETKKRPLYIVDEVRYGQAASNAVHELQARLA